MLQGTSMKEAGSAIIREDWEWCIIRMEVCLLVNSLVIKNQLKEYI